MPREGTEIVPPEGIEPSVHHDLKIRCPERGRKFHLSPVENSYCTLQFENKMPREGTEIVTVIGIHRRHLLFENKMPREGTEILAITVICFCRFYYLKIRCPERGRKCVLLKRQRGVLSI